MALPLFSIIAFLFLVLFLSIGQFNLYTALKGEHNSLFEAIPSSSIEIAKKILDAVDNVSLNIDNQYEYYYQQL